MRQFDDLKMAFLPADFDILLPGTHVGRWVRLDIEQSPTFPNNDTDNIKNGKGCNLSALNGYLLPGSYLCADWTQVAFSAGLIVAYRF